MKTERKKPDRCCAETGKQKVRWSASGSFTVEAVFLVPIIVLLIAFMLHLSMDWFGTIREACEDVDALRQLDTKTYFLQQDMVEGIIDALR